MRTKSPLQAEKILSAAARLFATHRFHEARMEDIASLAGVGKGTLYRYFQDKEELYTALLEQAAEGQAARLVQELAQARRPLEELRAVVAAVLGYFDENPHLLELITHAEAMLRTGKEFPWQDTRNNLLELVYEIFRKGAEAGEFRVNDPELDALLLFGMLRSILRFSSPPREPNLAAHLVEKFLNGADCSPRLGPPPYPSRGLPGHAGSPLIQAGAG